MATLHIPGGDLSGRQWMTLSWGQAPPPWGTADLAGTVRLSHVCTPCHLTQ